MFKKATRVVFVLGAKLAVVYGIGCAVTIDPLTKGAKQALREFKDAK